MKFFVISGLAAVFLNTLAISLIVKLKPVTCLLPAQESFHAYREILRMFQVGVSDTDKRICIFYYMHRYRNGEPLFR